MIKNYIVIAFRNCKRNKFYSFLNIFGLAIGISASILSFLFVFYELNYDRFHINYDRIYRIAVDAMSGNTVIQQTFTPAPMPAALYNEYPEIESVTRICGSGGSSQIRYENDVFKESNFLLVDTTFFKIFSAEFIHGNPESDIHLHSHLSGEFEANSNASYVYIFGIVAVFILIIACINFINLSTAKSSVRAREIGIRKVSGSNKRQLVMQFLTESVFICLISLLLAILLTESAGVVLNEASVKLLDWDKPVGKKINNWVDEPQNFHVIGVVQDLHYESMHTEIRPMGFFHMDGLFHWTPRFISLRINTNNLKSILDQVKSYWNECNPDIPFEYSFFVKDYDNLYWNEIQTQRLFLIFSIVAIFVACLGLFGLAAFLVEKRVKEIGIRKILGATSPGLIFLLSKQFTQWVLIANLLAWPLAWIIMENWLQNFTYRIEIIWWVFITAGFLAFIIALMTISSQVAKAAFLNPAISLRNE